MPPSGYSPPGTKPPKPLARPKNPKPVPLNPQPGQKGWKEFTQQRWRKNNPEIIAAAKARKGAAPAASAAASDPASTAAMETFRSTLAQLNTLSPEVDATAIRAPYEASKVATGQLGGGWSQAVLDSGRQAQQQYGEAHDAAQQRAASFGIASGAGAGPGIDDSKANLLLSQQTEAHSAAALAAASAWQGLLERTAGATVAKAQGDRQNVIDQGKQQLTLALPGMVAAEKDRALQDRTESDNMKALYSQLTEKQRAAMSSDWLRKYGIEQTAKTAAANRTTTQSIADAKLDETIRHNTQTEAATREKQAAAKRMGIQGIDAVMKLNPNSSGKSSTTTKGFGFTVLAQQYDEDGEPMGVPQEVHVSDGRPGHMKLQKGWKAVGKAEPNLKDVKTPAGGTGFSWPVYRQQIAILVGANRNWTNPATGKVGMTPAEAAKYLAPTPKTVKKKKK